MATSTRLFQGRVVADSDRKKGESLLASTPVVVLSAILGRTPTMDEYESAVVGINLTKFAPPQKVCVLRFSDYYFVFFFKLRWNAICF